MIFNRRSSSVFLISCLLMSMTATALAGKSLAPFSPESVRASRANAKPEALTAPGANSARHASKQNKLSHPTFAIGVAARFNSSAITIRKSSRNHDELLAYSSLCLARPRGRAPPLSS
jgi:hypothetical protein